MPEPYFTARKVNQDGTRNIYCPRCHEFICVMQTNDNFNSALCMVCQAADRGEILPQELIDQLRSRQVGHNHVPVFILDAPPPEDPMGPDVMSGRVEYFVKTISRKAKQIVAAVAKKSETSTSLAKEKKKSRLFDKPID